MKVFKPRKPHALKRGDTIGVVAPAWSFDPHKFIKGVSKLEKLGFNIKYDRAIFKKYWSMAGYDKERAEQINKMFADKNVKAIFCAKAGYGSIRTIPYLDKNIIRRNPKIFVGYSDITIILSYLYRVANMVVFHGPVISGEIHNKMDTITLKHLLRAIAQTNTIGKISFPFLKTLRSGKATGTLVGGNMSLLMSAIGTPYDIDTDGTILFLEDIGEDMETIDDYLMQLKLAGKLNKVKGIIFGKMLRCIDYSGRKYTIKHILNDILKDVKVPIIYGFPSGHRDPKDINVTLPLGIQVTIDTAPPQIIINEPAVI
jgi:muramoyltetrapeptide carboxypeptidase